MSSFTTNISSRSISGRTDSEGRSDGPEEDDILASAMAILKAHNFPLSLLPVPSDNDAWQQVKADLNLTISQVYALKKRVISPSLLPQKLKPESVDEDFSLSPASVLQDCLQLVPDMTVLQCFVGPGNCLFNVLSSVEGVTRELIASIVNVHREAIKAIAVKPLVDIELLLAIRLYTLQTPIPFYKYVNRILNNPDRLGLENIAPFMRLLVRGLYAMEDAGYGYTGQAYRGIVIGDNAALRAKFDQHEVYFRLESLITFAGFTSVSKVSLQAQNFGEEYGSIYYHFLHVRGVDISSVSPYPDEAEILVIPPAVFCVKGNFKLFEKLTVTVSHVEQEGARYLKRTTTVFPKEASLLYLESTTMIFIFVYLLF
jgi:hypothetical protein